MDTVPRQPKSFTIWGEQYTVIRDFQPIVDDDGTACCCHIDHAKRIIWISPGLSSYRTSQIITEAVSRAWAERMSWQNGPRAEWLSVAEQEKYVDDFEAAVAKILRS